MNKQQLAAKIWESANKMRSKIEANEYKDYILGFIFYKYLSDKQEQWLLKRDYAPEDIVEYVNEDDPEIVEASQQSLGYFIAYDSASIGASGASTRMNASSTVYSVLNAEASSFQKRSCS